MDRNWFEFDSFHVSFKLHAISLIVNHRKTSLQLDLEPITRFSNSYRGSSIFKKELSFTDLLPEIPRCPYRTFYRIVPHMLDKISFFEKSVSRTLDQWINKC